MSRELLYISNSYRADSHILPLIESIVNYHVPFHFDILTASKYCGQYTTHNLSISNLGIIVPPANQKQLCSKYMDEAFDYIHVGKGNYDEWLHFEDNHKFVMVVYDVIVGDVLVTLSRKNSMAVENHNYQDAFASLFIDNDPIYRLSDILKARVANRPDIEVYGYHRNGNCVTTRRKSINGALGNYKVEASNESYLACSNGITRPNLRLIASKGVYK